MQNAAGKMLTVGAFINLTVGFAIPGVTAISMFILPGAIAGGATLVTAIILHVRSAVQKKTMDTDHVSDILSNMFAGLFLGTSVVFAVQMFLIMNG